MTHQAVDRLIHSGVDPSVGGLRSKLIDAPMIDSGLAFHLSSSSSPSTGPTTAVQAQALVQSAGARGIDLSIHQVTKPEEIAPAIDAAKASGATALNVLASALLFNNRKIIYERVATWRLPAIYQWPEMAEDEGLLGYGPSIIQIYRDLSRQVVKVLRGIKPADIPVEQPTRFELVINLKAAHAIGHEIPAGLVLRADKLIEG